MQFIYKARHLKRFDRFPQHEQALILEANRQIRTYYTTRQAPHGLRIKQLYATSTDKIFEARASQAIRILWAEQGALVSFVLLGLHDEVKQYLRSLQG